MANKTKSYNESYYRKHRKEIIRDSSKRQKQNKEEHAKYQREYYASNPSYRKYKREYASRYRKTNPIKSKARKYRKMK